MLRELQALKEQLAQQQAGMSFTPQATPQAEQPTEVSAAAPATPAEETSTEAKDSSDTN